MLDNPQELFGLASMLAYVALLFSTTVLLSVRTTRNGLFRESGWRHSGRPEVATLAVVDP